MTPALHYLRASMHLSARLKSTIGKLNYFPEPDILLNKNRMEERYVLARDNDLPEAVSFYKYITKCS